MKKINYLLLLLYFLIKPLSGLAITASQTQDIFASQASTKTTSGANFISAALKDLQGLIDNISQITCESQEFSKIFKGQMDHTCTPTPLLGILAASILSPGVVPSLVRLSMNNYNLFGYQNCAVYNRTSYFSPEVPFGMCSDILLGITKTIAMAEAIVPTFDAAINGQDPIAAFNKSATLKQTDIYKTYCLQIDGDGQQGESMTFIDPPFFLPLNLVRTDDKVCVSTALIEGATSSEPIGCKYTKDPYELSKYAGFMGEKGKSPTPTLRPCPSLNTNDNNSAISKTYQSLSDKAKTQMNCDSITNCYIEATANSKTLLPISAPIINCMQRMLTRFLVNPSVCDSDQAQIFESIDAKNLQDISTSKVSAFYSLQEVMRKSVTALLILYLIINGATIFLGGMPSQEAIIMLVIKVVLVTYFSIGINLSSASGSVRYSGMIDIIYPFLSKAINGIASWVMSSGSSNLCNFGSEQYDSGENFAFWDALDCRTTTYLGISGFTDLYSWLRDSGQIASNSFDSGLNVINYSIPPYFPLLIAALWTKNISLVMLALSFPILVILIAAYIVQSFVVCTILIAIFCVLAPLFVPMALFKYTAGYFQQWMKLLISIILQPAVSATFAILVFSIYDYGFYGTCKYNKIYITTPVQSTLVSFFIDSTSTDPNCTNTLGWWLSDKINFSAGSGSTVTLEQLNQAKTGCSSGSSLCGAVSMATTMAVSGATSLAINTGAILSDTMQGLDNYVSSGNFITVPTAPLRGFFQVIGAMLVAIFAIYIGKQTTDSLTDLAAEMTEGINLQSVTINTKKSFDQIMAAAQLVKGMGKSSGSAKDSFKTGAGIKRSGAQDMLSKNQDANNQISTTPKN